MDTAHAPADWMTTGQRNELYRAIEDAGLDPYWCRLWSRRYLEREDAQLVSVFEVESPIFFAIRLGDEGNYYFAANSGLEPHVLALNDVFTSAEWGTGLGWPNVIDQLALWARKVRLALWPDLWEQDARKREQFEAEPYDPKLGRGWDWGERWMLAFVTFGATLAANIATLIAGGVAIVAYHLAAKWSWSIGWMAVAAISLVLPTGFCIILWILKENKSRKFRIGVGLYICSLVLILIFLLFAMIGGLATVK